MTDESASKSPQRRIPEFKTIEETAEFWDTHSSADYEDEFDDVDDDEFVGIVGGGFASLRMESQTLEALEACAREKNLALRDMLATWIEERLASERQTA